MFKTKQAKKEERLQALEARRAKLNAQIQRERSKLSQAERKRETRRKILIGATMLNAVEEGVFSEATLRALLDEHLQRDEDRVLFDLHPKEEP